MLTGAAVTCLWIFLPEIWSFSAEREKGEQKIQQQRYVPGENNVGAQETESSHQTFLVTMGMLYIVIHFLCFCFEDDPMREEKCCPPDSR